MGDSRIISAWPQFIPQLLQDVQHQTPEIRQPACYGISLAAKQPAFAECAAAAAESLAQAKKNSNKPAQGAADNALSALAEILLHHQQAVAAGEAQMWSVWLQGLPCQEDEDEGKRNHGILLNM